MDGEGTASSPTDQVSPLFPAQPLSKLQERNPMVGLLGRATRSHWKITFIGEQARLPCAA